MLSFLNGVGRGSILGQLGVQTLFTPPSEFLSRWTPNFNIYENGNGSFETDFDINTVKPTVAVTKYADKSGSDNNDGSLSTPYRTLNKAWDEGADEIIIGDGVWDRTDGFNSNFNPNRHLSIKALNKGKAILTRQQPLAGAWTQQSSPNNSVYVANRSAVRTVIDRKAAGRAGEFLKDGVTEIPVTMVKVSSVAACQATAGSWYQNGSSIYVHAFNGRMPDADILVLLVENLFKPSNDVTIYLEGLELWNDSCARHIMAGANTAIWAWKDCAARFGGASANGATIDGVEYYYAENCEVTDFTAGVDGFNYHANASGVNHVKCLEINCKTRRIASSGGTNNGSSAHDKCSVIRIGCDHQETYGPSIVEVSGAYSLNLNCTAGNSLVSGIDYARTAYQVGTAASDGTTSKTWLKNCRAVGEYYDRVQATGGELFDLGGFTGESTGGDHGTIS